MTAKGMNPDEEAEARRLEEEFISRHVRNNQVLLKRWKEHGWKSEVIQKAFAGFLRAKPRLEKLN